MFSFIIVMEIDSQLDSLHFNKVMALRHCMYAVLRPMLRPCPPENSYIHQINGFLNEI